MNRRVKLALYLLSFLVSLCAATLVLLDMILDAINLRSYVLSVGYSFLLIFVLYFILMIFKGVAKKLKIDVSDKDGA